MLHQLRKKLTLSYTISTGIILTVIVLVLAFIATRFDALQQESIFRSQLLTLSSRLQYESTISQNWLSSLENEHRMIIHISENDVPLLYRGSFQPKTKRDSLLALAEKKAQKEGINLHARPVSTPMQQTPLFRLSGVKSDSYLCSALVFSTQTGYLSMILIQDITPQKQQRQMQIFLFFVADLLGIFLLAAVNWKFVGRSLVPIQENEKRQHAFIAAASHELRSPLSVIYTSADAISCQDESSRHFIQSIKSECTRMSRLVQDLLLLASSKTQTLHLHTHSLDLDTLLLNMYERYERLCHQQHFVLSLDLPPDCLPHPVSDEARITQILSIFLDNGMSYAPKGTTLTIHARVEKHSIALSVIDHGCGIPDEKKAQVFEKFYRSDASHHEKSHFGLGLSVAKELAEQLHAQITLTDTPGGGCTFSLLLPYKA